MHTQLNNMIHISGKYQELKPKDTFNIGAISNIGERNETRYMQTRDDKLFLTAEVEGRASKFVMLTMKSKTVDLFSFKVKVSTVSVHKIITSTAYFSSQEYEASWNRLRSLLVSDFYSTKWAVYWR